MLISNSKAETPRRNEMYPFEETELSAIADFRRNNIFPQKNIKRSDAGYKIKRQGTQ